MGAIFMFVVMYAFINTLFPNFEQNHMIRNFNRQQFTAYYGHIGSQGHVTPNRMSPGGQHTKIPTYANLQT